MFSNTTDSEYQQHRAEERVEDFHSRGGPFVAAVEATRMPMVVTDPTVGGNPIVYVNQAFIDLFGYTREEVLGQNYFFLAGTNTDPEVESHIRAANTAEEPLNQEVLLYAKSGREVWAAQFVSPVHDDEGRIVQHFASFWTLPAGSGRAPHPASERGAGAAGRGAHAGLCRPSWTTGMRSKTF